MQKNNNNLKFKGKFSKFEYKDLIGFNNFKLYSKVANLRQKFYSIYSNIIWPEKRDVEESLQRQLHKAKMAPLIKLKKAIFESKKWLVRPFKFFYGELFANYSRFIKHRSLSRFMLKSKPFYNLPDSRIAESRKIWAEKHYEDLKNKFNVLDVAVLKAKFPLMKPEKIKLSRIQFAKLIEKTRLQRKIRIKRVKKLSRRFAKKGLSTRLKNRLRARLIKGSNKRIWTTRKFIDKVKSKAILSRLVRKRIYRWALTPKKYKKTKKRSSFKSRFKILSETIKIKMLKRRLKRLKFFKKGNAYIEKRIKKKINRILSKIRIKILRQKRRDEKKKIKKVQSAKKSSIKTNKKNKNKKFILKKTSFAVFKYYYTFFKQDLWIATLFAAFNKNGKKKLAINYYLNIIIFLKKKYSKSSTYIIPLYFSQVMAAVIPMFGYKPVKKRGKFYKYPYFAGKEKSLSRVKQCKALSIRWIKLAVKHRGRSELTLFLKIWSVLELTRMNRSGACILRKKFYRVFAVKKGHTHLNRLAKWI